MIIYLPVEHGEMRNNTLYDREITKYLDKNKIDYVRLLPDLGKRTIKKGSFLDAPTTIETKSWQIAKIAEMYHNDEINDGDIIFTSDLWFPGLESIAYLNYFCNKDVKIRGLLHAGSFTDTDFVRDMERWAKGFEDMLFDIVDKIYVGSEFIKYDVIKKRYVNPDKIEVTPFPLDFDLMDEVKAELKSTNTGRSDMILFSARNVAEKQPHLFGEMKNHFIEKDWTFYNTMAGSTKLTKKELYHAMGKSKVMVSFALQENYGVSLLEAAYMGCQIVAPDRLVYPEFYNTWNLYNTFPEALELVDGILRMSNDEFGEFRSPSLIKIDRENMIDNSIKKWFN